MNAVTVEAASNGGEAAWDAYVRAAPGGGFFHRFGWSRVIARAYGYGALYLTAKRGGDIAGVLPLIDVKSPLLGRSLISTAFTVGGGVLADDADAESALAAAALAEGRRRRVRYVELRSASATLDGWTTKSDVYAGFEREIPADEADCLNAVPRKRRAEIRKTLEAVERGELDYSVTRDIEAFYGLYAHALRDLGTPVFPKSFAAAIMEEFPDDAEILVIRAKGEPVLALLTFHHGERAMPYYFGAGPEARAHRAYDLAIWIAMRRGAARGARILDFGRSKYGTGSFDYKTHWGFEAKPLHYQYALIGARAAPNVNPQNPKFSAASAAWKRLPLPVATLAGPLLARHLA